MIKLEVFSGLSEIDPIWHHFKIVDSKLEKLGIKSWHEVQRVTPHNELLNALYASEPSKDGFQKFIYWLKENGEPILSEIGVALVSSGVDLHGCYVTFVWIFVNLSLLLEEDKRKYRSLDDEWGVNF